MASLDEIAYTLGKIQTGVERLREDFAEEKALSKENRAIIHRRLDETVERVAKIEQAVAITASDFEDLKAAFEEHKNDVAPTMQEWKRMKTLGVGFASLLAIGGLSFGSFLVWAGDTAVAFVRHWLRIGG